MVDLSPEQLALEGQGFVILASLLDHRRGEVLTQLIRGFDRTRIQGPVVITGTATFEEWERQIRNYYWDYIPWDPEIYLHRARSSDLRFYKVVAE